MPRTRQQKLRLTSDLRSTTESSSGHSHRASHYHAVPERRECDASRTLRLDVRRSQIRAPSYQRDAEIALDKLGLGAAFVAGHARIYKDRVVRATSTAM
jgi:hypothetical protein